jgi:hypothetical protein
VAPTIRIDDEVYAWLQKNARPFEDTPNSVLRRFAGLDSVPLETVRQSNGDRPKNQHMDFDNQRLSAKLLAELWNVQAQDVRYHRDGHFYENVRRFPAALFDPNGYILFRTEAELRSIQRIKVGRKTNVRGGIGSIPGYERMR